MAKLPGGHAVLNEEYTCYPSGNLYTRKIPSVGTYIYEYDDNGNLTQVLIADKVVWTYTYDAADRLIHAEDGTGAIKVDYGYDPFGRRLWEKVADKTTYFLYADEGLVGEYKADGTPIRTYGYLPCSPSPLFLKENGVYYYWYRIDRLGLPQVLVDTNGVVVWSAVYDVFGNVDLRNSTVVNNLRFPGKYHDVETGLCYNLNRLPD